MEKLLEQCGYYCTPNVGHGVRMLLIARDHGIPAVGLLTGPPGSGKTALGEALAKAIGAQHVYYMCHAWTDADELFVGIHVPAAVAGCADEVERPGVLAQVAQVSVTQDVVVTVDELDKAPEHVEALLLDWLQSGRVPVGPALHIKTDFRRCIVLVTSNGMRPHTAALISRCRRMEITPPPTAVAADIVSQRYGWPARLVRAVAKAGEFVRACEPRQGARAQTPVVVRELARAAVEIMYATSADDVACSLLACFGPSSANEWPVLRDVSVMRKIRGMASNIHSMLLSIRGARSER